jgi:hypothetical protein
MMIFGTRNENKRRGNGRKERKVKQSRTFSEWQNKQPEQGNFTVQSR